MDVEFAWAVGLFEGEGTVTICNQRERLALKMTDGATVRRFARAVGVGKVYGPYEDRKTQLRDGYKRQPTFVWLVEQWEAAALAVRMRPMLSAGRLGRVEEVFGPMLSAA